MRHVDDVKLVCNVSNVILKGLIDYGDAFRSSDIDYKIESIDETEYKLLQNVSFHNSWSELHKSHATSKSVTNMITASE